MGKILLLRYLAECRLLQPYWRELNIDFFASLNQVRQGHVGNTGSRRSKAQVRASVIYCYACLID